MSDHTYLSHISHISILSHMLTKDLSRTVKTVTNLKLPAATRHLKTYMLIREPEDLG